MATGNQAGAVRSGKRKRRGTDLFDLRSQYGTATQSVMARKADEFAREQFDWKKDIDTQTMDLDQARLDLSKKTADFQATQAQKDLGMSMFQLGTGFAEKFSDVGDFGWGGGDSIAGNFSGTDWGLGTMASGAMAGYGTASVFGSEKHSDLENFGYGFGGGMLSSFLSGGGLSGALMGGLMGGIGGSFAYS